MWRDANKSPGLEDSPTGRAIRGSKQPRFARRLDQRREAALRFADGMVAQLGGGEPLAAGVEAGEEVAGGVGRFQADEGDAEAGDAVADRRQLGGVGDRE